MNRATLALLAIVAFAAAAPSARAEIRIKDITTVKGARGNELFGIGMVIGLNNTGGTDLATQQVAIDMLRKLDVTTAIARQSLLDNVFKSPNIALVGVTAELPPFAHKGSKLDVVVSVIGGGASLEGGTLIRTPLAGSDGQVYAVTQGQLSIGGARTRGANNGQLNHPTVARVPGGAFVEKEVLGEIQHNGIVQLLLRGPDYSTSSQISQAINRNFPTCATAMDQAMVRVRVPTGFTSRVTEFIAEIGLLTVAPDTPARIVINERTGTVSVGENVRVSPTTIYHANMVINPNLTSVSPQTSRSSPAPLPNPPSLRSPPDPDESLTVPIPPSPDDEPQNRNRQAKFYTVGELVRVLNALGATPKDLISIFQSLEKLGALHAELVIM